MGYAIRADRTDESESLHLLKLEASGVTVLCYRCQKECGAGGVQQEDGKLLCADCDRVPHQPFIVNSKERRSPNSITLNKYEKGIVIIAAFFAAAALLYVPVQALTLKTSSHWVSNSGFYKWDEIGKDEFGHYQNDPPEVSKSNVFYTLVMLIPEPTETTDEMPFANSAREFSKSVGAKTKVYYSISWGGVFFELIVIAGLSVGVVAVLRR